MDVVTLPGILYAAVVFMTALYVLLVIAHLTRDDVKLYTGDQSPYNITLNLDSPSAQIDLSPSAEYLLLDCPETTDHTSLFCDGANVRSAPGPQIAERDRERQEERFSPVNVFDDKRRDTITSEYHEVSERHNPENSDAVELVSSVHLGRSIPDDTISVTENQWDCNPLIGSVSPGSSCELSVASGGSVREIYRPLLTQSTSSDSSESVAGSDQYERSVDASTDAAMDLLPRCVACFDVSDAKGNVPFMIQSLKVPTSPERAVSGRPRSTSENSMYSSSLSSPTPSSSSSDLSSQSSLEGEIVNRIAGILDERAMSSLIKEDLRLKIASRSTTPSNFDSKKDSSQRDASKENQERKERKRILNRKWARKDQAKKMRLAQDFEQTIASLQEENCSLEREIAQLRDEVTDLRSCWFLHSQFYH